MLVKAVEAEVAAYIETHQHEVDEDGRRLVVRNGHARERTIVSGVGQLKIQAPRGRSPRSMSRANASISLLRFWPYLRRTKSVEELIPWLYLKGISTGDFSEALEALLGPDAPGLSATTVVRLKDVWRREYEAWSKRDLSGQRFVYIWADGIYSNVRLDDERQCLLVVMGALEDGRKQLLAVHDGFRESELSWQELLEDLKRRGSSCRRSWRWATERWGFGRHCGKSIRRPVSNAAGCTRRSTCSTSCPRACRAKPRKPSTTSCRESSDSGESSGPFQELIRKEVSQSGRVPGERPKVLLAFYDFPAEHWVHLRTTNPIESTFATVRLRQRRTKGCGSREASLTMVFMLARQAERHWRRERFRSDCSCLKWKGIQGWIDGSGERCVISAHPQHLTISLKGVVAVRCKSIARQG